uniref:Inner centromere protein Alike [Aplysia californica] n=1 Tax=Lepeophtheirus salmonis TaxID=72036 RepID=A0A0K2T146_LEPSM
MERKSLKIQAKQCMKMIQDWAHEVDNIETQGFGDNIFELDKMWLSEVMSEVKSLVTGNPSGGRPSMVKEENEGEEEGIPLLLPKTPKVSKKRPNVKRKSEDLYQEEEETSFKKKGRKHFHSDSSTELSTDEEKSEMSSHSSLKPTTEKKSKSSQEEDNVEVCPEIIVLQKEISHEEMSVDEQPTLHLKSSANDQNNTPKRSSFKRVVVKSVPSKEVESNEKFTRKFSVERKLHTSISDKDSDNENNLKSKKTLSNPLKTSESPPLPARRSKSKRSISNSPLQSTCNSTFVIPQNSPKELKLSNGTEEEDKKTPLRRRSSRLSDLSIQSDNQKDIKHSPTKKNCSKESRLKDSKENIILKYDNQQVDSCSVRLMRHTSTMDLQNFESPKLKSTKINDCNERESKRRSSLCQYKGLVNKAIKTSITAEQKKRSIHEEVKGPDLKSSCTPLRQTRKMFKAFSAASSSGMKACTMKRTNSATRYASPLPSKFTSTMSSSSKVFLSSKSVSALLPRTGGGGPSNIVRGLTSLLPLKSPKPSAKDLRIKIEEESLRKRVKEEEAIRRKEERAKLKIEEKKMQREARMKKVMENKKMIERHLSNADLRKQENTAKSNKNDEKILKNEIREREERERERTRLKEIQIKQLQEEKLLEAEKKRLEECYENKFKVTNGTHFHANETFSKKPIEITKPQLNITITKNAEETTVNSYDMTPAPEDRSPEPLEDENNYDVGDLKSDDDTDDEDRPKKIVPKWAGGSSLRQAILQQTHYPPNVDAIFDFPPMPNLELMFPFKKQRFFKRTSSAVWKNAPISQTHF